MPNLPTYDNDQDGMFKPEMECRECGNTGIKMHSIDPKTGKSIRIRCECGRHGRYKRR